MQHPIEILLSPWKLGIDSLDVVESEDHPGTELEPPAEPRGGGIGRKKTGHMRFAAVELGRDGIRIPRDRLDEEPVTGGGLEPGREPWREPRRAGSGADNLGVQTPLDARADGRRKLVPVDSPPLCRRERSAVHGHSLDVSAEA